MKKADLLIAHSKGAYTITVEGRANFDYGLPLRNFAKNLDNNFTRIAIDLHSCVGMDSTFMGIMAMIGLKAQKKHIKVEIIDAGDNNRYLLKGLGLDKLFRFVERGGGETGADMGAPVAEGLDSKLNMARTVVEAHRALMDIDQSNVSKFEKVVEFAQQDIEDLKKQEQKKEK
ncbi:MAG: hypothetical protein PHH77_05945 [Victivallaceae bacterium]|nr:hypothetical protein [Victivallaceae bacterium]